MSDYPLCMKRGKAILWPSVIQEEYKKKNRMVVKTPYNTEINTFNKRTNLETTQYSITHHPELEPDLVSFNGKIWRFVCSGDKENV